MTTMPRRAALLAVAACAAALAGSVPAGAQTSPTPAVTPAMPVTPATPITVYVDGQPVAFDVPPSVVEGRVFIPLRGVFERLGATVDYDPGTRHIVAVRAGQSVELTLGSRQARVDGLPALLDVAPFAVSGRTMVPLRFVSESLGATVQWMQAQRVVLIGTPAEMPPPSAAQPPPTSIPVQPGGPPAPSIPPAPSAPPAVSAPPAPSVPAAPPSAPAQPSTPPQGPPQPPSPSASPPAQGQEQAGTQLQGRLVAVTTGETPAIVVRGDGGDRTVRVLPDTSIFRYNAETDAGGSAALGGLRVGDRVTVILDAQGAARKITATYQVTPGGSIASVDPAQRAVTLWNGRTFVLLNDAEITLNGQPADWGALQPGRMVRFLVVQGTNQAYAARVTAGGAQLPPARLVLPRIVSPADGQQIARSVIIRGTAQPGARVIVQAQPRLFGQVVRQETTVDPDGNWRVPLDLSAIPLLGLRYVISAVEVVNGLQSDPSSIEVVVR